MRSDITRDTFAPGKHFSRVIRQQGRVDIDADSNEQTSILLHYLRTLALDLIGPYARPTMTPGFALANDTNQNLWIGAGRYYVDGILVENEISCVYERQPFNRLPNDDPLAKALRDKPNERYWVYLDVWERHVTSIEDDSIREKALGGPDTCTRAKVIWQVKALDAGQNALTERRNRRRQWLTSKLTALEALLTKASSQLAKGKIQQQINKVKGQLLVLNKPAPTNLAAECPFLLDYVFPVSDASMGARVDPGSQIVDACVMSPDSKYRGAENQLYRVEIHRGGLAGEAATFKWARDNGSLATAWLGTSGYDLDVANARGFTAGNWVELTDDVAELRGLPGVLARLTKVEGGTLSVDPNSVQNSNALQWSNGLVNPKLRRWDHFATEDTVLETDGSILIKGTPVGTSDDAATWIDLEDGIQVQFAEGGEYRTGDYWLIPARVATGSIEWPRALSDSQFKMTAQIAPHGVVHHYAPLGFVKWANQILEIELCNCEFGPLSSCFAARPRSFVDIDVDADLPAGEMTSPDQSTSDAPPPERPARGTPRTGAKKSPRRATKKGGE